jgi:hypothetical protein
MVCPVPLALNAPEEYPILITISGSVYHVMIVAYKLQVLIIVQFWIPFVATI